MLPQTTHRKALFLHKGPTLTTVTILITTIFRFFKITFYTSIKSFLMKKSFKAYTLVSREFFYRSSYFFLCFTFCLFSSWIYEKELLFLYLNPLLQLNQNIMYTSISEAFSTSLRLCIWVSVFCCLPVGLYQILCFFLPSLFFVEKQKFYKGAFWVILLYTGSFILCRFYVIPELCGWFLKFGVSTQGLYLSLQACVSNYVTWSLNIYIICFCVLQVPAVFWILFQLGLWKEKKGSVFFSQNRKYASLCILLLCATISPPDVYSQGTIFFFSTFIYEYVLWYSFFCAALRVERKKNFRKY